MSIIAEELVEEWLNIQGFFTIRGARVATEEMDLLAVGNVEGTPELWHYEVSGSLRPMSYISDLPKEVQRATGRKARSAVHRTPNQLRIAVGEWVKQKFLDERKDRARQALWPGSWRFAFV